jgi:hypothetical protein
MPEDMNHEALEAALYAGRRSKRCQRSILRPYTISSDRDRGFALALL